MTTKYYCDYCEKETPKLKHLDINFRIHVPALASGEFCTPCYNSKLKKMKQVLKSG